MNAKTKTNDVQWFVDVLDESLERNRINTKQCIKRYFNEYQKAVDALVDKMAASGVYSKVTAKALLDGILSVRYADKRKYIDVAIKEMACSGNWSFENTKNIMMDDEVTCPDSFLQGVEFGLDEQVWLSHPRDGGGYAKVENESRLLTVRPLNFAAEVVSEGEGMQMAAKIMPELST